MRIAITGASGLLGRELAAQAVRQKNTVLAACHSSEPAFPSMVRSLRLDLLDTRSIQRFVGAASADWIIHCAAITDVDRCELEPQLAHAINAHATTELAAAIVGTHARLAYLSTDYVFDGASGPYGEDDSTHPINVYGHSKREGEQAVLSLGAEHLIIRSAGFLGSGGRDRPTFIERMMTTMRMLPSLLAAYDQKSNVTPVDELATGILRLIENSERGIWHIAHPLILSRYELGLLLAHEAGLPESTVRSVAYESLQRPARRPLNGGLRIHKAERALGLSFRPLDQSIRTLLSRLSSPI